MSSLHGLLRDSAARRPEHLAVRDPGVTELTYRELDALASALGDRLRRLGVRPGDRVGLCMRKSVDAVAAIFGAQYAGAVHVPVDASAPATRNALIFDDCAVRAIVGERAQLDAVLAASSRPPADVALVALDFAASPLPLASTLGFDPRTAPATQEPAHRSAEDDLAYILYTSGSTGRPKGVEISQRNARCFIDWCSELFEPRSDDRFSSHAPFHFDLSVLDIYVPLKHGATLVLVSDAVGKDPVTMAKLIADERITSWYSAPSILSLLCQFGHLERFDYSALRFVHFAGEVFPVKHLRAIKERIPHPRYFNLYGPTETNVCTYYEIPPTIPADRTEPFPIGKRCAHYEQRITDLDGDEVEAGEEGELWIAGPGVMRGYWNAPERNAEVFVEDPDGTRWYRTGDLVVEPPDGELLFRGRRDRMVKKRGYRIELGEIEAALYRHPDIEEAAVIAFRDRDDEVRIRAFLALRREKPSVIRMKQFCAEALISYMVPDVFTFLDTLPKTSTSKVDYQRLKELP